jgi:hypothetical protein
LAELIDQHYGRRQIVDNNLIDSRHIGLCQILQLIDSVSVIVVVVVSKCSFDHDGRVKCELVGIFKGQLLYLKVVNIGVDFSHFSGNIG